MEKNLIKQNIEKLKKIDKFKYFGEWIQVDRLVTNNERVNKLKFAYELRKNYYKQKPGSIRAKIRHYN